MSVLQWMPWALVLFHSLPSRALGNGHNRECVGETARRGLKRLGLLEDVILNIQSLATQRPGPTQRGMDTLW